MFLTVTLNPALDKTLWVDRNPPQETVRATRRLDLAGGKGINVARALMALNGRKADEVMAFFPVAGHTGEFLADLAAREGMRTAAVKIPGESRTAITIHDGETKKYWHYLEPGPDMGKDDLEKLCAAFLRTLDDFQFHTLSISGSLPSPKTATLVPWIVKNAKQRGIRVALDSFGVSVREALEAGPWLAKPNLHEWSSTTGEPVDTDAERWSALERMAGWGVEIALLSMGADGALAVAEGKRYRIPPVPVTEVNDLGGGDSMVAGVCWAHAAGYSIPDCLRWGAACGAANAEVWDAAGFERQRAEELFPLVELVPFD